MYKVAGYVVAKTDSHGNISYVGFAANHPTPFGADIFGTAEQAKASIADNQPLKKRFTYEVIGVHLKAVLELRSSKIIDVD